jgi:hypothetical protein
VGRLHLKRLLPALRLKKLHVSPFLLAVLEGAGHGER